jgi:excisionase family DNA binding protein
MNTNPLLTASDVARHLRISKALAYRLIVDGKLPGIRFGRTVRVREQDLNLFIKQNITISQGDDNFLQCR